MEPATPFALRISDRGYVLAEGHNRMSGRAADLLADPAVEIGAEFLAGRLRAALQWRERLFSAPFYRLIHAEADGLGGLILDRFGDTVVVQITTAGMERLRAPLLVFAAALSGLPGQAPSSADADQPLQAMVEAIKRGDIGNYLVFDRQGVPVQLW